MGEPYSLLTEEESQEEGKGGKGNGKKLVLQDKIAVEK